MISTIFFPLGARMRDSFFYVKGEVKETEYFKGSWYYYYYYYYYYFFFFFGLVGF
ncbi:hypothetical protein Syun_006656 [Stephania yunnanensis]|uniref:Uncharacterized protein n=1 Tax=Stephania yunnanensis TaxID=152371 RepID=A0AAP0PYQ2_9MAGN